MSQFATVTELFSSFDGGDGANPRRVRGFLVDAPAYIAELEPTTDPGALPRVGDRDTVNPELVCHSRTFRTTGNGLKAYADCYYTRPGEVWPTKDARADGYRVESGLSRIGIIRQPQILSRLLSVGGPFGAGDQYEYESSWIEYIIPEQVYEVSINVTNWSLDKLWLINSQTGKIHSFSGNPQDPQDVGKWLFQGGQFRHTRAESDSEFITTINYRWIGRSKVDAKESFPVPPIGSYLPLPELPPFHEYRVAGVSQGGPLSAPEVLTVPVYDDGDYNVLPGNPIGGGM